MGNFDDRTQGISLERIDIDTGSIIDFISDIKFLAFDIDQDTNVVWGITGNNSEYEITSFNLENNSINITAIDVIKSEAILRDVIFDKNILYSLWQPTEGDDQNNVKSEAFIIAHDLADISEVGVL